MKNTIVVQTNVEFKVNEEVERQIGKKIQEILDETSKKYHRNIKAKIAITIE